MAPARGPRGSLFSLLAGSPTDDAGGHASATRLALLRGGQVQRAGWYVLGTVMLALGATLAGSAVADELMRLGELGCLSTGNGGDGYGFTDERVLMRVHIGGRDRHRGKPQSQAIVGLLRERHYAGATVLRFATRTGARPMRSI